MSESTATPKGAMEHARAKVALEAAAVHAKPTLPIVEASDLPADVPRERLVWEEVLGAGDYASRVLERGSRLRIVDVEGDACVAFLAYNADATQERLNVADTIKVQWQAYPGSGSLLLSDMGRVLLTIVADSHGHHDAFCGSSTAWSNRARYGEGDNHGPYPNARDRFLLALAKHGLTKRDLGASLSFFRQVRVEADGALALAPGPAEPGRFVELRAEMRVLVVLANTPHVLDPRTEYVATPVRLLAWKDEVAGASDRFATATPERRRAFENVDDYYA